MYVYVCVCVFVCARARACVCVCMCVCACARACSRVYVMHVCTSECLYVPFCLSLPLCARTSAQNPHACAAFPPLSSLRVVVLTCNHGIGPSAGGAIAAGPRRQGERAHV